MCAVIFLPFFSLFQLLSILYYSKSSSSFLFLILSPLCLSLLFLVHLEWFYLLGQNIYMFFSRPRDFYSGLTLFIIVKLFAYSGFFSPLTSVYILFCLSSLIRNSQPDCFSFFLFSFFLVSFRIDSVPYYYFYYPSVSPVMVQTPSS